MPIIAIPYVQMPAEQNPNTKGRRSDTYLVSSFVTLASLRRWNPSLDLVFVTPEGPDAAWVAMFQSVGARIEHVPFSHEPPAGFASTFLGSLYLLDVINGLDSDYLTVVDPDVFCISSLGKMWESGFSLTALNIDSPREVGINGLSPRQADEVHEALGERRTVDYHYGGEFYGIPRAARKVISERVERAWTISTDRWAQGLPYFTTEEHIMNFALAGSPIVDAHDVIRRIWTAHSFRTVDGDEDNLLLWHLPSEKERGFRRVFTAAVDPGSWFWTADADEFKRRAARAFGLRNRPPLRWGLDLAGSTMRSMMDLTRGNAK